MEEAAGVRVVVASEREATTSADDRRGEDNKRAREEGRARGRGVERKE